MQKTALEHSCEGRYFDIAGIIVAQDGIKVDVASPETARYSPLTLAIYFQKFDLANEMLVKGASVVASPQNVFSALNAAVWRDNAELVQIIVKKGADVLFQGEREEFSPLEYALEGKQFQLFDIMMTSPSALKIVAEKFVLEQGGAPLLQEYRTYEKGCKLKVKHAVYKAF